MLSWETACLACTKLWFHPQHRVNLVRWCMLQSQHLGGRSKKIRSSRSSVAEFNYSLGERQGAAWGGCCLFYPSASVWPKYFPVSVMTWPVYWLWHSVVWMASVTFHLTLCMLWSLFSLLISSCTLSFEARKMKKLRIYFKRSPLHSALIRITYFSFKSYVFSYCWYISLGSQGQEMLVICNCS